MPPKASCAPTRVVWILITVLGACARSGESHLHRTTGISGEDRVRRYVCGRLHRGRARRTARARLHRGIVTHLACCTERCTVLAPAPLGAGSDAESQRSSAADRFRIRRESEHAGTCGSCQCVMARARSRRVEMRGSGRGRGRTAVRSGPDWACAAAGRAQRPPMYSCESPMEHRETDFGRHMRTVRTEHISTHGNELR